MKRIKTAAIIAISTLTVCISATESFAAQPERPEITIASTSPKAAKARIISANAAQGYRLVSSGPQELVFSKPYPSTTGHAPAVKPQMISRYRIFKVGTSTRISASIGTKMVHEGRGESGIIDLTEGIGRPELKAILQRVATDSDTHPKSRNG